jgi:phosphate:Na+ symporter
VAAWNLLFNILTAYVVFLFLPHVYLLVTEIAGIRNPLIALVAFQSFVNLLCILLFLPMLPWVSKRLESWFLQSSDHAIFISKVETSVADIAVQAVEDETKRFLQLNLLFTLNSLHVDPVPEKLPQGADDFMKLSSDEQYEYLKVLHGKILGFNSKLLEQKLNETESRQLERMIAGARNTMYAAKSVHDAAADIQQLKNSSKDEKYRFYREVQNKVSKFCKRINEIFDSEDPYPDLAEVYRLVVKDYEDNLQGFYHPSAYSPLEMQEISTLLNFNREMISALKSVVFALKELLLQKNEGDKFEALPGFIR